MGLISRVSSRTYRNFNVFSSYYTMFVRNLVRRAASSLVTKPAPAFKAQAVVNGAFKEVSLDDYKGRYLCLFFYPLDFTFVCPTEITAFNDRAREFADLGCDVVASSIDSHFSHLAWTQQPRKQGGLGNMQIPILADIDKSIARNYGILLEQPGIALRGLFIIDKSGTVRSQIVNDLPVGRSVDEALRLIKAFQFVEQHGEVCPANWDSGKATMVPTPDGSQDYFNNNN